MCVFKGEGITLIIERIDEKKLMIMLEEEDMNSLELTYDKVSWKNQKFKLLVAKLLALAKFRTGFSVDDCKLSIETVPQNPGCLLIFTLFPDLKKNTDALVPMADETRCPYIYRFDAVDDLFELFCKLERVKNHGIKSLILFRLSKKLFAVVYLNNDIVPRHTLALLDEYSDQIAYDSLTEARLREFGEPVARLDSRFMVC